MVRKIPETPGFHGDEDDDFTPVSRFIDARDRPDLRAFG